jgi:hypothetical protein
LTRARKDGSPERIAAAVRREREASVEAARILKESYAEVNLIIRGGLDRAAEFHAESNVRSSRLICPLTWVRAMATLNPVTAGVRITRQEVPLPQGGDQP